MPVEAEGHQVSGPQGHVRVEQDLLGDVPDGPVPAGPRRSERRATLPALGRCRPRITRNKVVLPAPLEPISPVNSPARTLKLTSSRIWRPDSDTLTPSTRSISLARRAGWRQASITGAGSRRRSVTAFWMAFTSASIHDW